MKICGVNAVTLVIPMMIHEKKLMLMFKSRIPFAQCNSIEQLANSERQLPCMHREYIQAFHVSYPFTLKTVVNAIHDVWTSAESRMASYHKRPVRTLSIGSIWFRNTTSGIVPITQTDFLLINNIGISPGSNLLCYPPDDTDFGSLPPDLLFIVLSNLQMEERKSAVESSSYLRTLWVRDCAVEILADELVIEMN
jgi:hypothetical protein